MPQKRNLSHQKLQTIPTSSHGGLQTRHCSSYSSQLSTHVAEASWKLLKLCPRAQICPWQRCCFPGSALKTQLSVFPPSTLQISDDLEQRVRAATITKLPNQEDEQEGKGGRHQQEPPAALAPVLSTDNAVRDTMTAFTWSQSRWCQASEDARGLCLSKAQVTNVLSHIRHGSTHAQHTGAQRTRQQPQRQVLCKCHPATGHLQAQDRFVLQLFTYKAPKKQTLRFVQTEMRSQRTGS